MNVTITPSLLAGSITPPPSKSQAHRLLIAAALGQGVSVLTNVAPSQDISATIACLETLGAAFRERDGALEITGTAPAQEHGELPLLDCGESGSTLRFLIPVALVLRGGGRFTGHGRLMERPLGPYLDLFREKGIFCALENGVLTVQGRLEPGEYRLPGNVSSQFFTGLLYALPLLEGDSLLVSTTRLESVGYVNMTRQCMEQFGVRTTWTKGGISIPGGQRYAAGRGAVEPDWSNAAFWYAAQGMGSAVEVTGMRLDSLQGDRVFLDWGRMIRGEPLRGGVTVPVLGPAGCPPMGSGEVPRGHSVGIDVSSAPDLVPPAAAWGAVMEGALYLKNAGRLRLKESDRLASVSQVLGALGARVWEEPERLILEGRPSLAGGVTVSGHNDHRIAMMAAIAATRCERPVTITGAQCVAKSYPQFWEAIRQLRGSFTSDK